MHSQQAIQNINLEVAIKINLKSLRKELIVYIEDSLGGDNN